MIHVSTLFEFIQLTPEDTGEQQRTGAQHRQIAAGELAELIASQSGRGGLVVLAAGGRSARLLEWIGTLADEDESATERLVEAMLPQRSSVSAAAAVQAQRNAEARQELIAEFGLFDSDELAALAGSNARNRSATASRWLATGRVFAVSHHGSRLFPAFQFDRGGQPRPVIAEVIEALEPQGFDGWEIALWFTTATGWLDDARPVDLLSEDPRGVAEAARRSVDE